MTAKGPLLIRVSVEYKDRPRIMQFELIRDWDKVKATIEKIQLKPNEKLMTITFKPSDKKE